MVKKVQCEHSPVQSHSCKLSPSQVFGSACALLCGLPSRKTVINCFSLVTQRATLVVLITRRSRKGKAQLRNQKRKNSVHRMVFRVLLVAEMGLFISLTSRIVENFACGYSARFLLALSPSHRINRRLEGLSSLTHSLRPEGHGRAKLSFETKKKKPTMNLWFNLGFFCVILTE